MLLLVFSGLKYSYCYEVGTGHYMLFDNEHKSHIYLQGDDSKNFRKQIEEIDILPEPEYKTGLLTENLVKLYL